MQMQRQRQRTAVVHRPLRVAVAVRQRLQCLRHEDEYLDVDGDSNSLMFVEDRPAAGRFSISTGTFGKISSDVDGHVKGVKVQGQNVHMESLDIRRVHLTTGLDKDGGHKQYLNEDLKWRSYEDAAIWHILFPKPEEEEDVEKKSKRTKDVIRIRRQGLKQKTRHMRVSSGARASVQDKINDASIELLDKAKMLAKHAGRKTIQAQDIERASQFWSGTR